MGIYIFNAETLEEVLESGKTDFGKEVIPEAIDNYDVHAYIYQGCWKDIGTMRSFYESNLDLGSPRPRFNLYDQSSPLYTYRRDLSPTKINSSTLNDSIASEGSIITDARIGVDSRDRVDGDYDGCAVREGLIIILKGAVIRDGTVI